MDLDDDWYEEHQIPPRLRARILAIKVCRNRCLAYSTTESALDVATPILKMLLTIIENDGSFNANQDEE